MNRPLRNKCKRNFKLKKREEEDEQKGNKEAVAPYSKSLSSPLGTMSIDLEL